MVTRQTTSRSGTSSPDVTTIETVQVSSIWCDRIDVSVLRDLVAALDAAEVDGRGKVGFRTQESRVRQIVVVSRTERNVPDPEMAPVRPSAVLSKG